MCAVASTALLVMLGTWEVEGRAEPEATVPAGRMGDRRKESLVEITTRQDGSRRAQTTGRPSLMSSCVIAPAGHLSWTAGEQAFRHGTTDRPSCNLAQAVESVRSWSGTSAKYPK